MENKKPACENTNKCTCSYTSCPRHGKCCDCVAYHKGCGDLPTCLRGCK